jgi:leukotriene-A4 hydrolase
MSAIRVSPPSSGPIHDGKTVGVDEVQYTYKQVRPFSLPICIRLLLFKPIPIAPYLLAIASGNIAFRAFTVPPGSNWTSGIWTEPEMMDRSFWEFSEDTPKWVVQFILLD